MGAFFCRRDVDEVERWWLEVSGKGSKMRLVPAAEELMAELTRYRRAHGLPPRPMPSEDQPLVLPVINQARALRPLSRSALRLVLKEVLAMAADRLRVRGPDWGSQADLLANAWAH